METQQNWSGNYTYHAARWHCPQSLHELQALVARCATLKVLGTRHSFNDVADTTGDMVSLAHFDKIVHLDRERHEVTVEAGIRYGTLAQYLDSEGYALHNLASLPHISVGGACATATHGSGVANANLASAVTAIEIVKADGSVVALARGRDADFAGAVVNVGALGVVTKLTLRIEPSFTVRQDVYTDLSFAELEPNLDTVLGRAYSVSLFTDWRGPHINQVWLKQRVDPGSAEGEAILPPTWLGATRAPERLHPIAGVSAENCTEQRGIPGPWYERLPHFRMDFMPSAGEEIQAEYFVPRQHAMNALHAVAALHEYIAPILLISEIRTIASDDLWLSPSYQQDCLGLHFTWKKDWPAICAVLPRIEEALAPFQVRPHWGKVFTLPPAQVSERYERLPDFQRLVQDYDPQGKFRNRFLDKYVLPSKA